MEVTAQQLSHQNWSENVTYTYSQKLRPNSVEELQSILQDPKIKNVRAQGTGHTFNGLASTYPEGVVVSLENLKDIQVEEDVVHFQAGVNFAELCEALIQKQKAILNYVSYSLMNVVGALVTCSHGAGYDHPILADYVVGLEVVHADGSVHTLSRDTD